MIPRKTFSVGDIVRTKKTHPCGGSEWEVLRIGADFRMKCLKCGHSVMLARTDFERSVKMVIKAAAEEDTK